MPPLPLVFAAAEADRAASLVPNREMKEASTAVLTSRAGAHLITGKISVRDNEKRATRIDYPLEVSVLDGSKHLTEVLPARGLGLVQSGLNELGDVGGGNVDAWKATQLIARLPEFARHRARWPDVPTPHALSNAGESKSSGFDSTYLMAAALSTKGRGQFCCA